MENYNLKKKKQLGMDAGTAAHRLKKELLFYFVTKAGLSTCFRCGLPIKDTKDFSVDHKIPWLDSKYPATLFFEISNIAYSHLICNTSATRQPHKYLTEKERKNAVNISKRKSGKKNYTYEKRRSRYLRNGK